MSFVSWDADFATRPTASKAIMPLPALRWEIIGVLEVEEVLQRYMECLGDRIDVLQRNVAFAPFYPANIGSMKSALVG